MKSHKKQQKLNQSEKEKLLKSLENSHTKAIYGLLTKEPHELNSLEIKLLAMLTGSYYLKQLVDEKLNYVRTTLGHLEYEEIQSLSYRTRKVLDSHAGSLCSSLSLSAKYTTEILSALFQESNVYTAVLPRQNVPQIKCTPTLSFLSFKLSVEKLDKWEQYLVYLHFYEEMSTREIEQLTGISKSTVNENLRSILKQLGD